MDEVLEATPSQASDGDGLARTLAVVGLQVSQVADELHHAARTVTAAEERVRDIELREQAAEERAVAAEVRAQSAEELARAAEERANDAEARARSAEVKAQTAEEQLAETAAKSAELLDMLQAAREAQTDAEERSRRAEQQLQAATDRAEHTQVVGSQDPALDSRPPVTVIVDDERTALREAVAAEVRRPLTSILGLTLALKHADPGSSDGKDMVKQLATNARKLDRLVGEMIDLDKIARGTYQLNLRRTDVAALASRVVDESPDLVNRDVKMNAEHATIEIDPALVEHMLETLLANAERRTAPGNKVWVQVSSAQSGVVIAVDDAGSEVPPAQREAMFVALSDDAPTGRQKPPAALALLSRLAQIHGGKAWVEERSGGGASFRVFLPSSRTASGSVAIPTSEAIDLDLPQAPSDDTVVIDTTSPDGFRDEFTA